MPLICLLFFKQASEIAFKMLGSFVNYPLLTLFLLISTGKICAMTLIKDGSSLSHCSEVNKNVYNYEMEKLDGARESLAVYSGQVLLIVNVATYCGYTEQYLDFNPLLDRNEGLKILAFPSNQFGLQEPGKNEEILNGLKHVRPGGGWTPAAGLTIYGKLRVNGVGEHPLYTFLKSNCAQTSDLIGVKQKMFWDEVRPSDVTWNFEKFLIDKKGRPRYRFHPATWQKGHKLEPFIQQLLQE